MGIANRRTIVVEGPADTSTARRRYYAALARFFLRLMGSKPRTILEAGSGTGQLTFPLLKLLPKNRELIALDSSKGPYEGSFTQFRSQLEMQGRKGMIRLVKSDVRRMSGLTDASVDAVVSNELLCDLRNETQLVKAFRECYRILRPGGVMVHGEWSSWPANQTQALTIKADSPGGTNSPSRFWNPDELFVALDATGFTDCRATYFETTMRLQYAAAVEELRHWGVSESFLRRNDKLLRRQGIELPFEHVVKCSKPDSC